LRKTVFIKNAAILTASSLILRFAGILFKVWLAARIGAEGIGLYQLVFSVYVLASTFATSGICTAVTRLVTEEMALGSKKGVKRIMLRCVQLTLIAAVISLLIVFFGADYIAFKFLGDLRAVPALKILCFSLPFMGISSCLRGYFIAARKASPPATAQLIEQAARIGFIMLILKRFDSMGISFACAAVLLGDTLAEAISAFYLFVLYAKDKKRLSSLSGRKSVPYPIVKSVLRIATPITSGRYLNSALRTVENILVPKALSKYSAAKNPLSQFGMIKGMALPLLFFPSTLLNSISTLLIPEMTEAVATGSLQALKSATEKVIRITSVMGFIFSGLFFAAGREIGGLVYKNSDVGFLLCALSPIVPLMYLDSVSDGILKGLDQQLFTFRTAVCDSSLRILAVIAILPRFGLIGFIGIMYLSNFFTCFLNVSRLLKITGAKLLFIKEIALPIISALFSVFLFKFILSFLKIKLWIYLSLLCLFSIATYFIILFISGSITFENMGLKRR